jgi:hypothetical protein
VLVAELQRRPSIAWRESESGDEMNLARLTVKLASCIFLSWAIASSALGDDESPIPAIKAKRVRAAISSGLTVIEKATTNYPAQRKCFSCHQKEFFDNGDPHGKDQFISIAATCWAVAALAQSGLNLDNRRAP